MTRDAAATGTVPPRRPAGGADVIGWVQLVTGLGGFVAAFIFAFETYRLLTDPSSRPSGTLDAVVSCGLVLESDQAALLGFPNPYLGIAGFAVIAASGAMRLAGGRPALWYRVVVLGGASLATLLVLWLIVQCLFVIRVLCPSCVAVWAATFTILASAIADVRRGESTHGPDITGWKRYGAVVGIGYLAAVVLVIMVT